MKIHKDYETLREVLESEEDLIDKIEVIRNQFLKVIVVAVILTLGFVLLIGLPLISQVAIKCSSPI